MSNENPSNRQFHYRGSLLFPVLLICLGIVFLLSNSGALAGGAWDTLIRLWPLILIVIGVDSVLRRGGLVGGALFIGVGAVFLLSNFDYLDVDIWYTILRLWPVLLIAIGFDVIIGYRRSLLVSLIALVVIVAVIGGALWMYGLHAPEQGGQALANRQMDQALGVAQRARIDIEAGAGSLKLQALTDSSLLVSGTVPVSTGSSAIKRYFSMSGDEARFTLRGQGPLTSRSNDAQEQLTWNLGLNPTVPIDLVVNLGAGEEYLDLTGLNLTGLKVSLGAGKVTVVLPANGSFSGKVTGAIGSLVIIVPQGAGVRIKANTGLASFQVPPTYQKVDRLYASSNYASAENRIDLEVGLVFGSVEIMQR